MPSPSGSKHLKTLISEGIRSAKTQEEYLALVKFARLIRLRELQDVSESLASSGRLWIDVIAFLRQVVQDNNVLEVEARSFQRSVDCLEEEKRKAQRTAKSLCLTSEEEKIIVSYLEGTTGPLADCLDATDS